MALELYAKQARNTDAERKASEIRLRAERRTGELLKDLARATPAEAGKASGEARLNASASRAGERVASVDTFPSPSPSASPYSEALQSTGISTQSASRHQAQRALSGVKLKEWHAERAKERMLAGKAGNPPENFPGGTAGDARDHAARQVGFSGVAEFSAVHRRNNSSRLS